MANEFQIELYVNYQTTGNLAMGITPPTIQQNQTKPGYARRTIAVGSTWTALDIGGVATERYLYGRHVDSSTNHIAMGVASFTSTGGATTVQTGEFYKNDPMWLPMYSAATVQFKTTGGSLKIEVCTFET